MRYLIILALLLSGCATRRGTWQYPADLDTHITIRHIGIFEDGDLHTWGNRDGEYVVTKCWVAEEVGPKLVEFEGGGGGWLHKPVTVGGNTAWEVYRRYQ